MHEDDAQSTTNSQQSESDMTELREKLSSVAWIQCDHVNCLKWRKVRCEVVAALRAEATWTCDMNEDMTHNTCSAPEENTAHYDKLAKRAKLDLVKSELKPGTLVWAKTTGYCRWPALITCDPCCQDHSWKDEDGDVQSYHVEYLGGKRSHAWVAVKSMEKFGPGTIEKNHKDSRTRKAQRIQPTDDEKECPKSRKRLRLNTLHPAYKVKGKTKYKGKSTVEKAVKEALDLLSKSPEKRLLTCSFTNSQHRETRPEALGTSKKPEEVETQHIGKRRDTKSNLKMNLRSNRMENCTIQETDKILCQKMCISECTNTRSTTEINDSLLIENKLKADVKKPGRKRQKKKSSEINSHFHKEHSENTYKKGMQNLKYIDFTSTLVNVSKEERLILDIEMYRRNESAFEHDVTHFMAHNRLRLASAPTWQGVQVSLFGIFLAVYERGGYAGVCASRRWSKVYAELVNDSAKKGCSLVKDFYRKNLYPYERYINGEGMLDSEVNLLKPLTSSTWKLSVSEGGDSGVFLDRVSGSSCDSDDFSYPEVMNELRELEQTLNYAVGKEKEDEARRVPVFDSRSRTSTPSSSHLVPSPQCVGLTGSQLGQATNPEEKAQVVPELDFPSSMGSSNDQADFNPDSEGERIFHEMQVLQNGMEMLHDQFNLL